MSELTVTIKQHAGFESSWLVLKGAPAELKNDLIEMCGEDREGFANLSLVEVVQRATEFFQRGKPVTIGSPEHTKAVETAKEALGGTVIGESTGPAPKAARKASKPVPEAPTDPVAEAIAAAGSRDALTDVFRAHREAILASDTLKAALKAANDKFTN